MKEDKSKFPIYYRTILCESDEEIYFLHWAFQLQDEGFIESIRRADTYELSDAFYRSYEKRLKTKVNLANQLLLKAHVYTPEFIIVWDEKSHNTFFQRIRDEDGEKIGCPFISHKGINGKDYSIVEIKPTFDQHNMERLFTINRKWTWEKYKIFVNLAKIEELFPSTFTPDEYLLTPTGRKKKINWEIRTLKQFLNGSRTDI